MRLLSIHPKPGKTITMLDLWVALALEQEARENPWPYVPEPHDGEHCQDCGRGYVRMLYSVTDELWAQFAPDVNLLCPPCLDARARAQGVTLWWEADSDWPHKRAEAQVEALEKIARAAVVHVQALARERGAREKFQGQAECDCVPASVSSKSCRKCGRRATITHEHFMEILKAEYETRQRAEQAEAEAKALENHAANLRDLLREWFDLGDLPSGGYGGTLRYRTEAELGRLVPPPPQEERE
jgi:hypothetical protein